LENNGTYFNNGTFEIKDIFDIVVNNLLAILLVSIIFGTVTYAFSKNFINTVYQAEATAALKISESADSSKITYSDTMLTQQLVDTYSIVLKSDEVILSVKKSLKSATTIQNEKLKEMITTSGIINTQVIKISVKDVDPIRAKDIANQILLAAPKIISKNFEGANLVPINAAKDGEPIYPNAFLNAIIAFLLGAILVVVIQILREYLDDTIKSDEQIRQMFGINVLGLLPEISVNNIGEESKTDKNGLEEDEV